MARLRTLARRRVQALLRTRTGLGGGYSALPRLAPYRPATTTMREITAPNATTRPQERERWAFTAGNGLTPAFARMNKSLTEGCEWWIKSSIVSVPSQYLGPVGSPELGTAKRMVYAGTPRELRTFDPSSSASLVSAAATKRSLTILQPLPPQICAQYSSFAPAVGLASAVLMRSPAKTAKNRSTPPLRPRPPTRSAAARR
jgi:hypothetical protein